MATPQSIATTSRRVDAETAPRPAAETLGSWRIGERLAAGRLTEVFRACPHGASAETPQQYALKRLRPTWWDHSVAVEQFGREAQAAREIHHPHVVSVLAAQVHEPPYYLVMPQLEGATLRDVLCAAQRPSLAVTLWLARQMAQAILAVSQHGWIHGDVTPANMIVSPDGHLTVIDLGSVRHVDEPAIRGSEPTLLGTPAYLAPEVLTSTLSATCRSDVYSLGAVIFEMLTARPYVDARDVGGVVLAHRQGTLPRLQEIANDVPFDVLRAVDRCLSRDPLRRPDPDALVAQLVSLEIRYLADRLSLDVG